MITRRTTLRLGSPSRAERGSLLVVVMWIAFGLVSLAILFGHSMMLENRISDNMLASQQAKLGIEGMKAYVNYLLTNNPNPGTMLDPTTYVSEKLPIGGATVWLLGRDPSADGSQTTPFFGLVDEASKLNINTATIEQLEALPGMTAEAASSIIDWRDTDDDVTESGAESSVYLSLNPPYNAKNSLFETLEELRLVNACDLTLLYGEDTNMNGILDANEDDADVTPPDDGHDGKLDPGILEYLTVYSQEPAAADDGTGAAAAATIGRVNVNTASEAVLATIFSADNAHSIVDYRKGKTIDDLQDISWVESAIDPAEVQNNQQYITTKSYQFSADIVAVGHDGHGYQRVRYVFDTRSGTPQVIFRQNLTRLGWALGAEIHEQLTTKTGS